MNTIMTTRAAEEMPLPSIWVACMLCICALNGATALACAAFVLHNNNNNINNNAGGTSVKATEDLVMPSTDDDASLKRMTRQNAVVLEQPQTKTNVCGKRKSRGHIEFPFARPQQQPQADAEITQGRHKQRRITKIRIVPSRFPLRSRSFGCDSAAGAMPEPTALRRVVSCNDVERVRQANPLTSPSFVETKTTPTTATPSSCVATTESPFALLREIRLCDVLSSAKAVVLKKLREAVQNAIDEVLTSIISFLTYGVLLFLLRQYSAVAVGVSLDLGAFSIEL